MACAGCSTMKYRPEIDGLRALAVLAVLFFHAEFKLFAGGFLGVDIFFVISGYLITTIMIADLESSTFTLRSFYERRIRRIVPALLAVCLVSTLFAWRLMFAPQLKQFATNLLGVITGLSNLFFWQQTGYFAPNNNLNPLIHTWSLSVEEQFYLIFPLLIRLTWKMGKTKVMQIIICLSIVSFLLAQIGSSHFPSANFYLLPTRAWELLVGCLAALIMSMDDFHKRLSNLPSLAKNFISIAGFLSVLIPIFYFTQSFPTPSWLTLFPILGAAIVIIFSEFQPWLKKVLSYKTLVGIGLMSYSLYLWHQPLFVLLRLTSISEPKIGPIIFILFVSFILAWLSWYFIERPFRNISIVKSKTVFTLSFICVLSLLSFSIFTQRREGFPKRFPDLARLLPSSPPLETSSCFNAPTKQNTNDPTPCVLGAKAKSPTIAIIGDSHVNRISEALAENLKQRDLSSQVFSYSYCAPLISFGRHDSSGQISCKNEINSAFEKVFASPKVRTVILFAEWAYYTEGSRWGDPNVATYSADSSHTKHSENKKSFEIALRRTIAKLKHEKKNIVFIKSTPEYEVNVPEALSKLTIMRKPLVLPEEKLITRAKYESRNSNVEDVIAKVDVEKWAQVIAPFELLCRKGICEYVSDEKYSLYEDSNHLSYHGAIKVVQHMFEKVAF